mgnify:CR=1 FL=1
MDYYVISVHHTRKRDRYITFWRPDNKGYAWPLSWSGKYSRDMVMSHLDYYNNGENIAGSCDVVDALTTTPRKGGIDGDAGPVVLNTPDNWRALMAEVIQIPPYPIKPKAIYFGRNAA